MLLGFLSGHTVTALSSSSSSKVLFSSTPPPPCVGYARWSPSSLDQYGINFFVIGTSHFRCRSASEVTALIEDVHPDAVVVELDPERVIRLTLQDSISSEEQLFGADFLAAIDTSQTMDIPLFIGDEYAQETKSRLLRTVLETETYNPNKLLQTPFRRSSSKNNNSTSLMLVDIPSSFLSDPWKLAPLVASVSPPLLLLLCTLQNFQVSELSADASLLLSIIVSLLATFKVHNTLIADRDEILAANAVRAARTIQSLKERTTIRKRWTFAVNTTKQRYIDSDGTMADGMTATDALASKETTIPLPLFTLKNPLERSMVRNLNLFEPRWLKMIDYLTETTLTSTDMMAVKQSSTTISGGSRLGCVSCTNKFYSAIDMNGTEGRYADIIFNRKGRIAELLDVEEGQRPSGARKVQVRIKGKESFYIQDEEDLKVVEEGYMVSSKPFTHLLETKDDAKDGRVVARSADNSDGSDRAEINIVVVVGLLHANGVLGSLSSYSTAYYKPSG